MCNVGRSWKEAAYERQHVDAASDDTTGASAKHSRSAQQAGLCAVSHRDLRDHLLPDLLDAGHDGPVDQTDIDLSAQALAARDIALRVPGGLRQGTGRALDLQLDLSLVRDHGHLRGA